MFCDKYIRILIDRRKVLESLADPAHSINGASSVKVKLVYGDNYLRPFSFWQLNKVDGKLLILTATFSLVVG